MSILAFNFHARTVCGESKGVLNLGVLLESSSDVKSNYTRVAVKIRWRLTSTTCVWSWSCSFCLRNSTTAKESSALHLQFQPYTALNGGTGAGVQGAYLEMKVLRVSLGGAALTPPGAVMSSTNRLSCSVLRSSLLHTHTHTHPSHINLG